MKVKYKGFELECTREKSLAGWDMLFYSAFRSSDEWELISSFSESEDTVKSMIEDMKKEVDEYLENPEEYEKELDFNDT